VIVEGEMGVGTALTGIAGLVFIGYVYHKVSKKRSELRETVRLLTDESGACVVGLEALVRSGSLKPVS
jgi:hypothetical protein